MSKEINFVNPYNFIPFKEKSDKVPPEEEKVLSGVINYIQLTILLFTNSIKINYI